MDAKEKVEQNKGWQEVIWKNADELHCWGMKWSNSLSGWVCRIKDPCLKCEHPTCKSVGKKRFDAERTYHLNLLEEQQYNHKKIIPFEEWYKKYGRL